MHGKVWPTVFASGLLVACASPPDLPALTPAERSELVVTAAEVSAQRVKAGLDPMLGEGPFSGFFKGLGAGFLGGLTAGIGVGVVLAPPLFAYSGASCGKWLSAVKDPVRRLQDIADEVGLAALKAGLDVAPAGQAAPPDRTPPKDAWRLEVVEVELDLGCRPADGASGAWSAPDLMAMAKWRLVKLADGQAVLGGATSCKLEPPSPTFEAWFADRSRQVVELRQLLGELGQQVSRHVRAAGAGRCSG
jgi:hypothetical protein